MHISLQGIKLYICDCFDGGGGLLKMLSYVSLIFSCKKISMSTTASNSSLDEVGTLLVAGGFAWTTSLSLYWMGSNLVSYHTAIASVKSATIQDRTWKTKTLFCK